MPGASTPRRYPLPPMSLLMGDCFRPGAGARWLLLSCLQAILAAEVVQADAVGPRSLVFHGLIMAPFLKRAGRHGPVSCVTWPFWADRFNGATTLVARAVMDSGVVFWAYLGLQNTPKNGLYPKTKDLKAMVVCPFAFGPSS